MRRALTILFLCSSGAGAAEPARIHHTPPAEADAGRPLFLMALIDGGGDEASLVARYRRSGAGPTYSEVAFERSSAGGWYALIPADAIARPGVEYYIAGVGSEGFEVEHFASALAPHLVRVEPDPDLRWIEAERQRLGGRRESVRASVWGQDFGGNAGPDRYLRGEVSFTHRVVSAVYSFTLGYGFLEGRAPFPSGGITVEENARARYGYGGVRFRLHPAVWLDTRAVLGFSDEGVMTGVGAAIVLGTDWRASVTLGGEVLEDLGPSGWLRLQWDTVPPLLMGATIQTTSLPAADGMNRSSVIYDICYPMGRVTIGASVSYSARGTRPGGFGGGLQSSFEF